VPAQFVKPYVKSNKNDTVDAEAIAEAATRPTVRFVASKRPDQTDLQALHRARDGLVCQRTAMISQMRGFLLEYGIACRKGAGVFKLDLAEALGDAENDLTPAFRKFEPVPSERTPRSRVSSSLIEFGLQCPGIVVG